MTTNQPMSRFEGATLEDLPEDIVSQIMEVQEKSGFIPSVFLGLARRPEEFRAFFAYHNALMEKDTGLTKGEREMIVVATSGLNHCTYCVVAHGAILRIREKNPRVADQVATNYRTAEISERQKTMLKFASKVCLRSHEVSDEDLESMRDAGFTDDEIWDIGAITAFYAMSNRLASFTGMRPNDEFYLMGRVPKGA